MRKGGQLAEARMQKENTTGFRVKPGMTKLVLMRISLIRMVSAAGVSLA